VPNLVLRPTDAAVGSLLHTVEERSVMEQEIIPLAAMEASGASVWLDGSQ
jgi:hypothetical protein